VSFKDWKARMSCTPGFARTAAPRNFKAPPAIQAALLPLGWRADAKASKALRQDQAGNESDPMRPPLTWHTIS